MITYRDWDKISTLGQLYMAAKQKKAVVVPDSYCWSKPKPAIVLLHQQGASLVRLFDKGMFIYKKPIKQINKLK